MNALPMLIKLRFGMLVVAGVLLFIAILGGVIHGQTVGKPIVAASFAALFLQAILSIADKKVNPRHG